MRRLGELISSNCDFWIGAAFVLWVLYECVTAIYYIAAKLIKFLLVTLFVDGPTNIDWQSIQPFVEVAVYLVGGVALAFATVLAIGWLVERYKVVRTVLTVAFELLLVALVIGWIGSVISGWNSDLEAPCVSTRYESC